MNINSDINVLGSLSDYSLIYLFLKGNKETGNNNESNQVYSNIKTLRSFKRFKSSINNTLIKFYNPKIEALVSDILNNEKISSDSLRVLFWNASINNELINYLNKQVYFPAFFSNRATLKKDEVVACLEELKQTEKYVQKWSYSTINTTSSKYLTFLKKFLLMKGGKNKTIEHFYLSDKLLILFVYIFSALEPDSNLIESKWIDYCFTEKEIFIHRIMQKQFIKYFNIDYSGDKLRIETTVSYEEIYNELK
ncbi:MAG: DUF1819 family protein [Desulfobacterales bacterium]|nr:DUF1819 family protein [Desulfobacterales bacterium]MBF0397870.1 DUF1819 family protein [Desulfobacterales bacterium]